MDVPTAAAIAGVIIASLALFYQVRRSRPVVESVRFRVVEWETLKDNSTNVVFEESVVLRCFNEGSIATAVTAARFEMHRLDERGRWDLLDVVGADQAGQLSMPLRLDVAQSVDIRFVFRRTNLDNIKECRLQFVFSLTYRSEKKMEVVFAHEAMLFDRLVAVS